MIPPLTAGLHMQGPRMAYLKPHHTEGCVAANTALGGSLMVIAGRVTSMVLRAAHVRLCGAAREMHAALQVVSRKLHAACTTCSPTAGNLQLAT